MSVAHPAVAPTADPALEQALRLQLQRRTERFGSLGELEPLALRLGMIQGRLAPRFVRPQLVVFAADHGLAVDGLARPGLPSAARLAADLLATRLPLPVFARLQGLELQVVDAGLAEPVSPHPQLLARKIAHGTRNARVGPAMSPDQARAAIRAGLEIAEALPGNVLACAGIGVGAHESAALILSRLAGCNLRELLISGPAMKQDELAHRLVVLQGAQGRHREANDPLDVLAAFGGFEIAMMVGALLGAASRRCLIVADGLPAFAAVIVAARIAPAVGDYCVYCRSHGHHGLDEALRQLHASALLELGMDGLDGTGAALAWPLIASAVAVLSELAVDEDAAPAD